MPVLELKAESLGRVEGELDVSVKIDDGRVIDAWTEGTMFRGFEIILRGKDPQAGLIMTPRICGICGGSHLTKASYALDTAWRTELPPNANLVRAIAQASETAQSIPRWFYALFAIDLINKKYAKSKYYAEAAKRWTPFVGTHYEPGVTLSNKPVEIYAIFGGQWPHSSFMIPGGVMCGPTLSDVTRARSILEYFKKEWIEKWWLGCSIERYMQIKTWEELLAWCDENESQHNSDLAFFIRYARDVGLDSFGQGCGRYLTYGTYYHPDHFRFPSIEGRAKAVMSQSGIYDGKQFHEFDQARVREDHTHSFFKGGAQLHPFDGVTDPIDPEQGRKQGKYTWAKAPRYDIPGFGLAPMEVGTYARGVMCGKPNPEKHQDSDPLMWDIHRKIGPSVMTRVLSRVHEGPKLIERIRGWLDAIKLNDKFYIKPTEHPEGQGFGGTEASRGALGDWIKIKNGKIENYQVITPTAWNIGPRDGQSVKGPMEQAIVGAPIHDPNDPIELGHVVRSFDSCLVCTVHAYDARTDRELARFKVGGVC